VCRVAHGERYEPTNKGTSDGEKKCLPPVDHRPYFTS
jgi:hypothetical protein